MLQPSTSLVDAVSGEEVCPLCFDRYSGADACTCVVCRVASCPSCAELLDVDVAGFARELDPDGAVRCFACRPASSAAAPSAHAGPRASTVGREPAHAPFSLPRPIQVAAREQVPAGLPALPFPLTTSPRGVRVLQPRAPGTVFVGLPPVASALSQSLGTSPPALAPVAPPLEKLARRARQKLLLLARLVTLGAAVAVRAKPLLAQLQQEGRRLRGRLPGYRALARERFNVWLARGTARFNVLLARGTARFNVLLARGTARFDAARAAASVKLAALGTRLEVQTGLLRTRLAGSTWLARASARFNALLARASARFAHPVAKPPVADPSRPIHL